MGTDANILAAGWGYQAWLWLVVPIGVYCACSLALFAFGRSDGPVISNFFFGQISDSLRRLTGFPGWAMAGVLSGLLFLLILVIGFYWDVAWHIDYGRDVELFTPSHTMILVGLVGFVYSAFLTMGFATLDKARVGFKYGVANVPWSSVLLLFLGFGGMVAFPLDNLWHEAYGLDVTLWSPTHLQLVGGGALGTIGLFLMCAEAMPSARPTAVGRAIFVLTGGTVLVALSAVQAEFDFGVPQFQALYLPLLIMVAAGMGLVLARLALGPWGAVKVALVYLGLRGFLALVVGGVLNHTVPRFPLYLASAVVVEAAAAWVGVRSRLRFAVVAGALVGTVGLVGELAWVGLSGWSRVEMPASMALKVAVLGPLAAVAAAVLGAGLGRAFASDDLAAAGGWVAVAIGCRWPLSWGRALRWWRCWRTRCLGTWDRWTPSSAPRSSVTKPWWRSSSTRPTRPRGRPRSRSRRGREADGSPPSSTRSGPAATGPTGPCRSLVAGSRS